MVPNYEKKKDIITWIHVHPNLQMKFILKNHRKWSFSYETKVSIHLSQWREWVYGTQSWTERKLLYEFMIAPTDRWTFILKNSGKWSFFYETEASISFIPKRRMCLWCPIMKKKIIIWIRVCPKWQTNFNSKKWLKVKFFLWSRTINIIYPNEENVLMLPNNEKKGDYYMNPYLSQLTDEIWF